MALFLAAPSSAYHDLDQACPVAVETPALTGGDMAAE